MQDVIEGSRLLANPRPLYYIVKFRLVVMSNQEKERFQQSEFHFVSTDFRDSKKRGGGSIVITDRDIQIVNEVSRWRGILGRQVQMLCGFDGVRACDRRLKLLIDEGFLTRRRYIYGVAGLLGITEKARREFNITLPVSEPRLDQIYHDIAVTDTALYIMYRGKVTADRIVTEKELRNRDGFTTRKHMADFIFTYGKNRTCCVEVELNTKAKARFMDNIKQNYLTYDYQQWIVPQDKVKIRTMIQDAQTQYPNIRIIDMEVINDYIEKARPK